MDGKEVAVPFQTFCQWNDERAKAYHETEHPARRREIAAFLFDLNLPLFQPWDVFDAIERQNYEQEAYLYLVRALERFQPGRGSFVHFLREYYVKKLRDATFGAKRRDQDITAAGDSELGHVEEKDRETRIARIREASADQDYGEDQEADSDTLDPLLDRRIRKILTKEQYRVFHLRVNEQHTMEKVADICGMSKSTAQKRLQEAIGAIRLEMEAKGQAAPPKAEEGRWIARHHFCRIFAIAPQYLKVVLNQGLTARHSPYRIDPRDMMPLQGGRIRYLETENGLVYPRLIRRSTKMPISP